LRALLVGLFAFVLAMQVSAAAIQGDPARASRRSVSAPSHEQARSLNHRLERKLAAARKYRRTIRSVRHHRELLSARGQGARARAVLRNARTRLMRLERTIGKLRSAIRRREARRLAAMPPRAAICHVFEERCREAVAVAWCESRLSTTARNGQYLGLFQMGSSERRLFGHGPTARDQAVAAHRYFLRSGRDWSPWGCRWAAS
jgi:hypothetical protein